MGKERCDKCVFRMEPGKLWKCNYEGVTGHTRKAQPADKCTFFIEGPRIEDRHKLTDRLRTMDEKRPKGGAKQKYDWTIAEKLYAKRANDGEISRAVGCPVHTVLSWRKRNNLPANTEPGGQKGMKKTMILEDILRDLRHVENGGCLMSKPLAKQAADTIEILLDRVRYLEEKLAGQ